MEALTGKVVFVTGASKGIGAAIARAAGAAGAFTIIHYANDKAGAEEVAANIPADRRIILQAGLHTNAAAAKLWADAVGWKGRIDVFVNNAGGRALLREANDEGVAAIASGPGGRRDVVEHRCLTRQAHRRSRQAIFDQIHSLREAGNSIGDIARQTGFGSHTIRKWLKFDAPPERRAMALKPCSPPL